MAKRKWNFWEGSCSGEPLRAVFDRLGLKAERLAELNDRAQKELELLSPGSDLACVVRVELALHRLPEEPCQHRATIRQPVTQLLCSDCGEMVEESPVTCDHIWRYGQNGRGCSKCGIFYGDRPTGNVCGPQREPEVEEFTLSMLHEPGKMGQMSSKGHDDLVAAINALRKDARELVKRMADLENVP